MKEVLENLKKQVKVHADKNSVQKLRDQLAEKQRQTDSSSQVQLVTELAKQKSLQSQLTQANADLAIKIQEVNTINADRETDKAKVQEWNKCFGDYPIVKTLLKAVNQKFTEEMEIPTQDILDQVNAGMFAKFNLKLQSDTT